jgi:hypothetical protein
MSTKQKRNKDKKAVLNVEKIKKTPIKTVVEMKNNKSRHVKLRLKSIAPIQKRVATFDPNSTSYIDYEHQLPNDDKSLDDEKWERLSSIGFNNYYISSHGRVMNCKRNNQLLHPKMDPKNGFVRVSLVNNNGKNETKAVHQLVADVFIPNPENKPTVIHVDKNHLNNCTSNLCRTTYKERSDHAVKAITHIGRPIYQLDPVSLSVIKRWDRISDATAYFNLSRTYLANYCLNDKRKIGGGYKWKYCDEIDEVNDGEIWEDVPYPEYEPMKASNYGRIKRLKNGKTTSGRKGNDGYMYIAVRRTGTKSFASLRVHRLVLSSFKGRNENLQVNHKNGVPSDNTIENLEYATSSENMKHAHKTGLIKNKFGNARQVIQYTLKMEKIARYASTQEAQDGRCFSGLYIKCL